MNFKTLFIVLTVLVWVVAITCGVTFAISFDQTPGARKDAPSDWPQGTSIERFAGKPSVVMFAHPRCPCTHASLVELRKVLHQARRPVEATIVLMYPPGAPERWTATDLTAMALEMPGVRILHDLDGRAATRFGAETSGDVMLYSCDGHLLFRGGITQSRGHEGDNPAADSLVGLLNGTSSGMSQAPIFGCPLFDAKKP